MFRINQRSLYIIKWKKNYAFYKMKFSIKESKGSIKNNKEIQTNWYCLTNIIQEDQDKKLFFNKKYKNHQKSQFFLNFSWFLIHDLEIMIDYTVKLPFLARDRERTVPMYVPDIYQNDRDEKLNQKKFTLTITVTRQERNFHCNKIIIK